MVRGTTTAETTIDDHSLACARATLARYRDQSGTPTGLFMGVPLDRFDAADLVTIVAYMDEYHRSVRGSREDRHERQDRNQQVAAHVYCSVIVMMRSTATSCST